MYCKDKLEYKLLYRNLEFICAKNETNINEYINHYSFVIMFTFRVQCDKITLLMQVKHKPLMIFISAGYLYYRLSKNTFCQFSVVI